MSVKSGDPDGRHSRATFMPFVPLSEEGAVELSAGDVLFFKVRLCDREGNRVYDATGFEEHRLRVQFNQKELSDLLHSTR